MDISSCVIDEIDTRKAIMTPLDVMIAEATILGDLAMELIHPHDLSSNQYSCTFTYNPFARFSLLDTYDQYVTYDEHVILKDPKKVTRTRQFGNFSFQDQYRIFRKHFGRWYKQMNKVLDKKDQLKGYKVYIEKTKVGTLHAHAIIHCNCNYNEAFGNISATIWASIAKGQVRAMQTDKKKAFDKVYDSNAWSKYISKDTGVEI